jgi:hypothetical protein
MALAVSSGDTADSKALRGMVYSLVNLNVENIPLFRYSVGTRANCGVSMHPFRYCSVIANVLVCRPQETLPPMTLIELMNADLCGVHVLFGRPVQKRALIRYVRFQPAPIAEKIGTERGVHSVPEPSAFRPGKVLYRNRKCLHPLCDRLGAWERIGRFSAISLYFRR